MKKMAILNSVGKFLDFLIYFGIEYLALSTYKHAFFEKLKFSEN